MRVHVLIPLVVEIPTDLDERASIYGTTDPATCIEIDLENDPAAFILEAEMGGPYVQRIEE